MERITLDNYLHTELKDIKADIEVTYTQEIEGDMRTVTIDEVFVNGANITDLLDRLAFNDIADSIHTKLTEEMQTGYSELRQANVH